MNLKVVVAPDSFKGSLTAAEACDAIEKGLLKVFPDADIIKVPMADGGEGTAMVFCDIIQLVAKWFPAGSPGL